MHIGRNVFCWAWRSAVDRILEYCGSLKVVLIADVALVDAYAMDLSQRIQAELLTIPSGETAKHQDTASHLMHELFKMGCGRDTLLIALGGGVTTDLVGFVASIYMRGIPYILIPTTLLAIVDAAIGGKTAINTSYGKNLIGTLYDPKAIFIDLSVLNTLPEREQFNGLAEILKMGLVYDASIWDMAEHNHQETDLILKAVRKKIEIVEQDPMEQSVRHLLNFGHTIGHALETVAHYSMPHGRAVALGCLVEAHLSMCLGYLSVVDFERIQAMYRRFALSLPKEYHRDALLRAMTYDKKKKLGETRFVLIDAIGHAIPFGGAYCRVVSHHELEGTLDWMERM